MTAYEYLVFQSDKKEWQQLVKKGEMGKDTMDKMVKEIMDEKEH